MQARYESVARLIPAERTCNCADRAKYRSERDGLTSRDTQSGAESAPVTTRKVKGMGVVRLGVFGNLSAVSSDERKNRENYDSEDATHKSEMRTMQIEPAEMRGPTDDSGRREGAQARNDADTKRES